MRGIRDHARGDKVSFTLLRIVAGADAELALQCLMLLRAIGTFAAARNMRAAGALPLQHARPECRRRLGDREVMRSEDGWRTRFHSGPHVLNASPANPE
jgi:hypothetical protein